MSDVPNLSPAAIGSPSVAADASRLKTTKNLKAAGEQFEAIFTGMMLKAMRSTHLAEDIFGSKAQDQFRDMWDSKTVQAMASHTPLGIGKAMTEFLARSQSDLKAAAPSQADVNHDPPETAK